MNLAHRTVLAVLVAALLAVPTALAAVTSSDGVWANGTVHHLVVTGLAPTSPAPTGTQATPLYVIAPVSASRPLHPAADAMTKGFGAHDHVIALAHHAASSRGTCDLTLVVPGPNAQLGQTVKARSTVTPDGPKPLLYAVRVGKNFVPLTWASRIRHAVRDGLATAVDTQTYLTCTVFAH